MVQISDNKCTIVNGNPFSSILSWRIPCTEEPGGLQSVGLQRVGRDWLETTEWLSLFPYPILPLSFSFSHWSTPTGLFSLNLFVYLLDSTCDNLGYLNTKRDSHLMSMKRNCVKIECLEDIWDLFLNAFLNVIHLHPKCFSVQI